MGAGSAADVDPASRALISNPDLGWQAWQWDADGWFGCGDVTTR